MVDMPKNPTEPNHIYLIYIHNEDLALNNLQWLICHKTQPNHLILSKQMSYGLFQMLSTKYSFWNLRFNICNNLSLNILQWLKYHKTQPTKQPINKKCEYEYTQNAIP